MSVICCICCATHGSLYHMNTSALWACLWLLITLKPCNVRRFAEAVITMMTTRQDGSPGKPGDNEWFRVSGEYEFLVPRRFGSNN